MVVQHECIAELTVAELVVAELNIAELVTELNAAELMVAELNAAELNIHMWQSALFLQVVSLFFSFENSNERPEYFHTYNRCHSCGQTETQMRRTADDILCDGLGYSGMKIADMITTETEKHKQG